MLAKANMPFLDCACNVLRKQGDVFEVGEERFSNLNDAIPGVVSVVACGEPAASEAPASPVPDEADDNDELGDIEEMTCAQLRELIESKGAEAPAKAKRAELAEIAAALR